MISGKKYILSIERYLKHIEDTKNFKIGILITDSDKEILENLGFSVEIVVGESLSPDPLNGKYSMVNVEGYEIKLKDLPKEEYYTELEYMRYEWHGKNRIERSDSTDIRRKRFKRKKIPGCGLNFIIEENNEECFLVVDKVFIRGDKESEESATFSINLLLENFKRADIFTGDLDQFIRPREIRQLNWDVFPSGDPISWSSREKKYQELIVRAKDSKKGVILSRFKTLYKYKPDFEAFGVNGFSGYVILGFTSLDLYVFESAYHGNATYFIKGNWEEVSKLTKGEIIENSLHEYRLIHREKWDKHIDQLLAQNSTR